MSSFKDWLDSPSGFGNFTRWELLEDNVLNMSPKDWREELYEAFEAGARSAMEKDTELLLKKWLNLGERIMTFYPLRIDANMGADFAQGVRETKELLEKRTVE